MDVRLIDANKIEFHDLNNRVCPDLSAMDIIDEQPTIDVETLPIVKELRREIDRLTNDGKQDLWAIERKRREQAEEEL